MFTSASTKDFIKLINPFKNEKKLKAFLATNNLHFDERSNYKC